MNTLLFVLSLVLFVGFTVSLKRDDRIVGGTDANYTDFSYMVSIKITHLGVTYCGGTLLSDQWILTAAHCIFKISINDIEVYTGSGNLFQGTPNKVKSLVPHEGYKPKVTANDIGLIRLASPVDGISFVELESKKNKGEGVLIGWGYTENHEPSSKLQKLDVQYRKCSNMLAEQLQFDPENFICASNEIGKGACTGDSGGPLIDVSSKKQVGVVSGGAECAKGIADIFTYIPKYKKWIDHKMNE